MYDVNYMRYWLSLVIITILGGVIILTGCQSSSTNQNITDSSSDQSTVSQSEIIYLDVREDDERAAGHVEGAIHLPLGQIEAGDTDTLPRDVTLAVYCRSGRRSAIAVQALQSQWFTNLIDAGGMDSIPDVTIVQ